MDNRARPCPCCGHLVFDADAGWPGSYEICPVCFWEDDAVQFRYPTWAGGANLPSLIEAQQNYQAFRACDEQGRRHVRPAAADEPRDPAWRPIDLEQDAFEDPNAPDRAPWPADPAALCWWLPNFGGRRGARLTGLDVLPEALRSRVVRLHAGLSLGGFAAEAAVWLACDLLVAGADTPAVVDLAGEPPRRLLLADAEPLVRRMLAELGVEPVDTQQAAWMKAGDIARHMVAGTLPAEDGAAELWRMWWDLGNPQEVGLLIEPLDAWHDSVPAQRDDDGLRSAMRRLAEDVIEAADARTAAAHDETDNG